MGTVEGCCGGLKRCLAGGQAKQQGRTTRIAHGDCVATEGAEESECGRDRSSSFNQSTKRRMGPSKALNAGTELKTDL